MFSPAQVRGFLESRAVDLGTAGKDNTFGAGRLYLAALPDNDNDGLPDPADPDDDNDGFSDSVEAYAGTDPLDACPPPDDAFPPDINNDTRVNVLDVAAYDPRFDMNADGRVNILDITRIVPLLNSSCSN